MDLARGLLLKTFFSKETKAGELLNRGANRTGCLEVCDWALKSLDLNAEQKEKVERMHDALRRERVEVMQELRELLQGLGVDPESIRMG